MRVSWVIVNEVEPNFAMTRYLLGVVNGVYLSQKVFKIIIWIQICGDVNMNIKIP